MSPNPFVPIVHSSAPVEEAAAPAKESLVGKIEAGAEKIEHDTESILVKVFGSSAASAFEADLRSIFETDTLAIFTDAIGAVESLTIGDTPATGAQKRDAAFSKIASDLSAAGKSMSTSVINLGIEMVVGLLKSKSAAV
jgi:hypothetical protein